MEKAEHAARLRAAMAARGADRTTVVDATGVAVRTVTNWTTGKTMPSNTERASLRRLFPGYDEPGDPVEVAIMSSELTEDRKYALVGNYKRMLREQAEGTQAAG
ncbi:MAG TPA: hypothetical protein VJL80_06325 [Aeromicrobium sp.]|nr:hypothetical protein [Aeromicrobium sp.]HKY57635.1 hypothetical protein [Aeromicrobium sp.]